MSPKNDPITDICRFLYVKIIFKLEFLLTAFAKAVIFQRGGHCVCTVIFFINSMVRYMFCNLAAFFSSFFSLSGAYALINYILYRTKGTPAVVDVSDWWCCERQKQVLSLFFFRWPIFQNHKAAFLHSFFACAFFSATTAFLWFLHVSL